jgi:hypothetical protein
MRTILGVTLTFSTALFLVAVGASVLEIWATSRDYGDSGVQMAEVAQPAHAHQIVLSGFFPVSARR